MATNDKNGGNQVIRPPSEGRRDQANINLPPTYERPSAPPPPPPKKN